ncbi:Domain of unknown function DUF1801 [Flavobacteriaceae bacterium]
MQSDFKTPQEYLDSLPEERKIAIEKLRKVIKLNLPEGFQEEMSYGMLGYVVPHSIYPKGYHCKPNLPLPFMNIASQKNFIALYHMGIYANPELLNWFVAEYSKLVQSKIDMGKSCIRFKKIEDIPYELIGELAAKMTVLEWISIYENNFIK